MLKKKTPTTLMSFLDAKFSIRLIAFIFFRDKSNAFATEREEEEEVQEFFFSK